MESKDEFLKIDIKNRMCYYFGDIMTVEDIYSSGVLLNEKNISIYDILYKTFIGS